MAVDDDSEGTFGCKLCWPTSAEAAWEVRGVLTLQTELIDESHFHVMILSCPGCDQRFVSVFTELIDWVDGDDPQAWSLLPLTPSEASGLQQQGAALTEAGLSALGRGRRCLYRDCPKGSAPQTFWSTGLGIGAHD